MRERCDDGGLERTGDEYESHDGGRDEEQEEHNDDGGDGESEEDVHHVWGDEKNENDDEDGEGEERMIMIVTRQDGVRQEECNNQEQHRT